MPNLQEIEISMSGRMGGLPLLQLFPFGFADACFLQNTREKILAYIALMRIWNPYSQVSLDQELMMAA